MGPLTRNSMRGTQLHMSALLRYEPTVKAVAWTESLATVGWSWVAAVLPVERGRTIKANDKSVRAEADSILFLMARLLIFKRSQFFIAGVSTRKVGDQHIYQSPHLELRSAVGDPVVGVCRCATAVHVPPQVLQLLDCLIKLAVKDQLLDCFDPAEEGISVSQTVKISIRQGADHVGHRVRVGVVGNTVVVVVRVASVALSVIVLIGLVGVRR